MTSEPSATVHAICNRYVDDLVVLSPIKATFMGVPGYEDQIDDFSPDGLSARISLARRALVEIEAVQPCDTSERAARAVFIERTRLELEKYEAGMGLADLNVVSNAMQTMRTVFNLMPCDTVEDWTLIAARMAKVPAAIDSYRVSLVTMAEQGNVSALRQINKVAERTRDWAGLNGNGFFSLLISQAKDAAPSLQKLLSKNAQNAEKAYADLADFLKTELAPKAPEKDAIGEPKYQLCSRYYVGARLDLRDTYEWGWAEFSRIEAEMRTVCARIKPGATLAETAESLDGDHRYRVQGRDALQRWLQDLSDSALNSLQGKHFDIPDQAMNLECKIAPPGGSVGMYYTGPSMDFRRPGRMSWSLPADRNDFSTWRETSVVYHEGVPGHHLQIATALHQGETLNKFQRLLANCSGYLEGWALYAERLMQDLGYLSDDGDLLGMLDSQLFRAARVIVDIGMHLELAIPSGTGFHEGERWTPELGLEFLLTRTLTDPEFLRDELDRYLGWPGQAPSYKLGERLWLSVRDDARRRRGSSFDLKEFHTKVLQMGGMGLDTLCEQLRLVY